MSAILLASALAASLYLPKVAAVDARTDINPALRYYQAYLEKPDLSEADHDYLFTTEWNGRVLGPRFDKLIVRYDPQFRFLRDAEKSKAACDWGIDLTQGPDALLPGLAPAKAVSQVARLRTLWHLQNQRPAQAREELVTAYVLARNLSKDGVLISALVQFAMEQILTSGVASTFYQWPPEQLKELMAGFDGAPPRGTVAQCVQGERIAFRDWLQREVEEIKAHHTGDDAIEKVRALMTRIGSDESADTPAGRAVAERVIQQAGGTLDGVLKLVAELSGPYTEAEELLKLPYAQYDEKIGPFMNAIKSNPNPLISQFLAAFEKCRNKEFAVQAKLAMVRAAVEYKLHGEAGLKSVPDPFGEGPFEFRRFKLKGEDRGFQLSSAYAGTGYIATVIFVEKGGPPFRVDGIHVGEPINLPPLKD